MPTSEPEDEKRPAPAPHGAKTGGDDKTDEPAWPPAEARPEESGPTAQIPEMSKDAPTLSSKLEQPAAPSAAEPEQEMGLSESTLHWLVDSDKPLDGPTSTTGAAHHEDRLAAIAGRKRTALALGGLLLLGLLVALVLHLKAASSVDSERSNAGAAAVLTRRAESALSQGRRNEAMELAHLAIITDPQSPDAYVIAGSTAQAAGRPVEAREAFRRYLELAPEGPHAQQARDALATLPP